MFSSPTLLFFDVSDFLATVDVRVVPLAIGIAARAEPAGLSVDISTGAGDSGARDSRIRVGDDGKSNIGWAGGLGGGLSRPIEPGVDGDNETEGGFEAGATGSAMGDWLTGGATIAMAGVVIAGCKGSGTLTRGLACFRVPWV